MSVGPGTLGSMEPAVWALIALLGGTIFGGIFYLGSRLDALGARVDRLAEGVGGLQRDVGRLEGRFDRVEGRVERVEHLLEDHVKRHAS